MSSTRRATGNGPLRQERFASSPEFERGLMANLVATRCSVLDRAEDRELIWFLQLLSHKGGGLKKLAAEFCQRYPQHLATDSMRRIGNKPGQVYSASQVRAVRAEIPDARFDYPLAGEFDLDSESLSPSHRESYPASIFAERCRMAAADGLEKHLACLCLDPALSVADGHPWYFPRLVSTLRGFQPEWTTGQNLVAITSIGTQVFDALDYALESRRLVLIDGQARIGKTFAAKAWCAAHPGRARYIEVPSTNDDIGFYRAIAMGLGVSVALRSKAQELRQRIEETLQAGDLAVVFDEAHYLWPQSHYRAATPGRVNWLMTALVNRGVPTALLTTPQFMRSQKETETRTCWTSEQFIGRIGHYEKLPGVLTAADLEAVAHALLPDGDALSIEALVLYAQSSAKYLAGIETAVCRAQFIAQREQRTKMTFADIKRAIRENVIPSDSTFAGAMQAVAAPARKRALRVPAIPLQPDFMVRHLMPVAGRSEASRPPVNRIDRAREPDLAEVEA